MRDPRPSGASRRTARSRLPTVPRAISRRGGAAGENGADGAAARAPALEPRQAFDRRPSFREHERQSGPGLFCRRADRGHHHRSVATAMVLRIARNSTFAFKNEAIDVRAVASQLGVRYVLEGSVRRAAGRVRVTGQLIDAAHGVHMWGEKYDRELADIFELQDDITQRVIGSVGPGFWPRRPPASAATPPNSMDAWDLVMRALPHMWRVSADEQRRAQHACSRRSPSMPSTRMRTRCWGGPHQHVQSGFYARPSANSPKRALEAGARAVDLNEEEPWGHLVLGLGHARRRRPHVGHHPPVHIARPEPRASRSPMRGWAMPWRAAVSPSRGAKAVERARRLSPRDPFLAI